MQDLISRQAAIELAMQYCPDDDGTCSKADEDIRNLLDELEALPSAQPEKLYTKADYIMALHKEYGCSFVVAEEAHNKALEYLRDNARMKG